MTDDDKRQRLYVDREVVVARIAAHRPKPPFLQRFRQAIKAFWAVLLWSVVAALWVAVVSCTKPPPALTPRHVARGAVLSVAYATKIAVRVCADRVRELAEEDQTEDEDSFVPPEVPKKGVVHISLRLTGAGTDKALALVKECRAGYETVEHALTAAAYAVDAWGSAEANAKTLCALDEALSGLEHLLRAIKSAGAEIPSQVLADVEDARRVVPWLHSMVPGLAGACALSGGH